MSESDEDEMQFNTESYKDVKTWQDLIDINVKYLKGEIKNTFYTCGSIHNETTPLLPKLFKLHELGFMTECGQPADIYIDSTDKTWIDDEDGDCGDWTYEEHQKSFVFGYMPIILADKLKEYLDKCDNIIYKISYPNFIFETNMQNKSYNLTKSKILKQHGKDIENPEWKNLTNSKNEHTFEWSDIPNVDNILETCCSVEIIYNKYGEGSAEDVLIKFFETN